MSPGIDNRGADVHLSNNGGRTALIHASTYGQEACITKLQEAGANVNAGGW